MPFVSKIKFVDVDHEESMKTSNAFYDLGIRSYKSLLLLNYLLQWKVSTGVKKWRGYSSGRDAVKGGGLLVKADPNMTITTSGEVGIYFDNSYRLGTYLRSAMNKQDRLLLIMNKMAAELKQMWLSKFDESEDGTLYINYQDYAQLTSSTYAKIDYVQLPESMQLVKYDESDEKANYIEISQEEYRCLYEFLKNRDKNRTIAKYGKEAYDSMIGKQIEDQFIISAIDVLKAEIQKTLQESSDKYDQLYNERTEKIKSIESEYKQIFEALEAEKNQKVADLKNQILEMQKMAV